MAFICILGGLVLTTGLISTALQTPNCCGSKSVKGERTRSSFHPQSQNTCAIAHPTTVELGCERMYFHYGVEGCRAEMIAIVLTMRD